MSSKITAKLLEKIDDFDEDQLRRLNHIIVQRLDFIRRGKELDAIARFDIGDRVAYDHYGEKKIGKILRLNQRSITVKFKDGTEWLISPRHLTKI